MATHVGTGARYRSPGHPSRPAARRAAALVVAMWLGAGVVLLGGVWDGRWHAAHPGQFEGPAELAQAHLGYWLGVAVLFVAAGAALSSLPVGRYGLRRWGAALVLVGSAAGAVGMVWDGVGHATGGEVEPAHLLSRLGLLVVLPGLVLASLPLGGRAPSAG